MQHFNPQKLTVTFRTGVTPEEPVSPRRYTLSHSGEKGDLFLTISRRIAYDKLSPLRDEITAEWRYGDREYIWYLYCYVGSPVSHHIAARRFKGFQKELPRAIKAIRHGDAKLFSNYPELDNAPIMVCFESAYPEFNRTENWGTAADYTMN